LLHVTGIQLVNFSTIVETDPVYLAFFRGRACEITVLPDDAACHPCAIRLVR
jgi:hypothetical protein